jgi:hypothetical protein
MVLPSPSGACPALLHTSSFLLLCLARFGWVCPQMPPFGGMPVKIESCAKAPSGPAQYYDPPRIITLELVEILPQLAHHRCIKRVQSVGSIKRQPVNRTLMRDADRRIFAHIVSFPAHRGSAKSEPLHGRTVVAAIGARKFQSVGADEPEAWLRPSGSVACLPAAIRKCRAA